MAAPMRFRSYVLNQARQNLASNNFGAAFHHYLLALKLDHHKSDEIHEEFVSCMCQWTELLDSVQLSEAFSQAKAVCFFSDILMTALAEQAVRLEKLSTAVELTRDAKLTFPHSVLLKETWEYVSYATVERWHFKMLNDVHRNRAYHDAIVSSIQKNALSSVLDIGCGTGLLSVFAEKGGAEYITLCDAAPVMTEICLAVIASHHQQTRSTAQLRVFKARSTTLSVPEHIPERVDLVVTEIFDAALFGEHCLSSLSHAWCHLLHNTPHRKGRVIPQAAQVFICAIQCPEIRKENCVQQGTIPLLDLRDVPICSQTGVAEGEPYTTEDLYFIRNSYTFLSPVQSLMRVDFNDPQNLEGLSDYDEDLILDVYAEGTVDALAVWFDLDLGEGAKISTSPSAGCCWEQAIFPVVTLPGVHSSPKVKCGDQLKIHCSLNDGCLRLQVQDIVALGYFLNSCHISSTAAPSSDSEHKHQHRLCQEQKDRWCSVSPSNPAVEHRQGIRACVCPEPSSTGDQVSHSSCCGERDCCLRVNGARTESCGFCRKRVLGDGEETDMRKDSSSSLVDISEDFSKIPEEADLRKDSSSSPVDISEDFSEIPDSITSALPPHRAEPVPPPHEESTNSNSIQNHHGDLSLPNSAQRSHSDTFCLGREEIRHLNDSKFNSLLLSALQHAQINVPSPRSLRIISHSPPLHGLLALKSGFDKVDLCYVGDSDREEVEGLMDCVGRCNGISGSRWKWCGSSVEDAVEGNGSDVDVACVDVVEMAGCLRGGLLKELKGVGSVLTKDAVMMPQTIDIYAVLISSQHLQSMSRVTSDENTQGVRIAPHINPFQTQTFLDLDIHTLPHENLSDVVHVFHLDIQSNVTSVLSSGKSTTGTTLGSSELHSSGDLNTEGCALDGSEASSHSTVDPLDSAFSQSKQLVFTAQRSGEVTAVVFWFDLQLAPGVSASTVDPTMHWKQAAFLLNGGDTVNQGQQLTVTAHLEKSYLHFSLG